MSSAAEDSCVDRRVAGMPATRVAQWIAVLAGPEALVDPERYHFRGRGLVVKEPAAQRGVHP